MLFGYKYWRIDLNRILGRQMLWRNPLLCCGRTSSVKRAMVLVICLLFSQPLLAEKINLVKLVNDNARYADGLLRLAMSKLDEPYTFANVAESTTTARIIEMMDNDELDVFWVATTREYEQRMLPVRVPLYRGLLGYRVFMIKRGNQFKFHGIEDINDLNRVSIGQGRAWSDTLVMESNGITVEKVTRYESLFHMLDGDRFDAFPRGVQEPWGEIVSRPDLELAVEEDLMLSYVSPYYFFVKKSNAKLAAEIEKGLLLAMADGSFQEYFLNDPTVRDALTKANLKNRKVIVLKNPLLPEKTPVDNPELWLDPYLL